MHHKTASSRTEIAQYLFGKADEFPAYFRIIDELREPSPVSHEDVLKIVELLKANPRATWTEANPRVREQNEPSMTTSKINNAINIAVQAIIMVDCAARDRHSTTYEVDNYRPISWELSESFLDFNALKAWKLKKRLAVTFRITDDLAEHLLYDSHHNVLYLFHQTAFLKAHLERSRTHLSMDCGLEDSLKFGILPPQLLVETLHSLQAVLFPIMDDKSADILTALIRKIGFDSDCNQYDGYMRFKEPPEDFIYQYWGERLARLEELIMRRDPRNKMERWFRWHTTDMNFLVVALLALAISIVVGLITITVTCVQTWIAWQAWKHPVIPLA
ncbi:hypothetical protein K432DRAFT_409162 [Lepidopterella palustris CBS 459.81]|uniref:Uncharacterized protein n=1 Tax=Lepidopterella palustris CBS 459.81 TaxID=1314670 RepID=A0A8E2JAG2_9PEZI|nr:hypothetical protein K432DRAFT_409162 [Lepidopterella palustris CBS 459.81]